MNAKNMNLPGRIARIEKSVQGKLGTNPDSIKAVLRFFKNANIAEIPESITFQEVQAAALKLERKDAARLPGLSRLREALGEKCKGDILDYIASRNPGQIDTRVIYEESERNPNDELFSRLGFHQIFIIVYQTRPPDGQKEQS